MIEETPQMADIYQSLRDRITDVTQTVFSQKTGKTLKDLYLISVISGSHSGPAWLICGPEDRS